MHLIALLHCHCGDCTHSLSLSSLPPSLPPSLSVPFCFVKYYDASAFKVNFMIDVRWLGRVTCEILWHVTTLASWQWQRPSEGLWWMQLFRCCQRLQRAPGAIHSFIFDRFDFMRSRLASCDASKWECRECHSKIVWPDRLSLCRK